MLEKITKDKYLLEVDECGVPIFSQENFKLINTFLNYDSNYNLVENDTEGYYPYMLKTAKEEFFNLKSIDYYGGEEAYIKNDLLYQVIVSIDRTNSTHLASQGQKKGGTAGRLETAKGIYSKIPDLGIRLFNGDAEIVGEIARFGGKNNFSFASKFCSYVCRYIFKGKKEENNYCIYDNVVQSILPYYAWKYRINGWERLYKTNRKGNKVSTISDWKEQKNGYALYRQLIVDIIEKIKEETNLDVNFEYFDHLLWYSFKGTSTQIQNILNTIKE